MKIEPSGKVKSIGGYAFDEVEKEAQKLRSKGINPIDFGVGDPKEPTPGLIRSSAKKSIDANESSGYPPYNGSAEFRQAVSSWAKRRFGISLDTENEVVSTIGSKEGIFNFPQGFLNPGDYVLVPTPGYPPWSRGTMFASGIPYFLSITKDNHFYPDFSGIPKKIVKKARILWINYPNNPTSSIASKAMLKEAVDFGHDNNIIVASDEAYSEFYFEEEDKPHSALEISMDGVVAFNSLSKRSFMTSYRVGWAGGDSEIIRTFRKVKTNIDSGTSPFVQDAAIAAYSDEKHVMQMRELYKEKRDIICSALREAGMEDCTPKATMYIWQELPEGISSVDFAKRLLSPDTACVVTPGEWLSQQVGKINPGKGYVRFALVPTMAECRKAAERLRKLNI
ncbi:aminotransferase class I/II-fold pyridoxal phosphate-dependent enzyme [Candidatus Woesearchaeota archaeon]|nr:aminotransferase class I/II-fold pyridoxal phosphate-dependent enzyme [Candidatus Woesearchaeota archaeon]